MIWLKSPPDWMEDALCIEVGVVEFYPEKGESAREAKKVCTACEVQSECLEFAMAHDDPWGVWGGLSPHERRVLKKQIRQLPLAAA